MQKRSKKNQEPSGWFLEGPNRYGNFPVYRFEEEKRFLKKEEKGGILSRVQLLAKNTNLKQNKEGLSAWEVAVRASAEILKKTITYYKEYPAVNRGRVYVVLNAESKEMGEELCKLAKGLVGSGHKEFSQKKISDSMKKIKKAELNAIARRYVQEAALKNIPATVLNRGPAILQLGYGSRLKKVWSALTSNTSRIGAKLTSNKFILNKLLKKIDIPVPRSEIIRKESEVQKWMRELSLPVVIKPIDATVGRGVNTNIKNVQQAKKAYQNALKISKNVMMEEQIEGFYYRLTFVDGKMIACAKALPVILVGDGRHTLRELIDSENKKTHRQENDKNAAFYKIKVNEKIKRIILSQGHDLKKIIKKKEAVYLSFSGADGGEWIEDNKAVNPENIKIIQRAVKFAELNIAGVDVISRDISKPFNENNGKILEINAGPDISVHANASRGKKIIIEKAIVESLFPKSDDGRIPIVSITGTNGKTTTSKLLAYILNNPKEHTVGLTTSADKFINGELVKKGDMSGALSAKSLLINPEIDIAILETCHILGIDRRGLGYDWSDASIITNLTADHLETYCTRTIDDLFQIKAVVARRTRKEGYLVLNADDPRVAKMAKQTKATVVYFSLNHDNEHIKENIKKTLPVYYSREGYLWEEKKRTKTKIIAIKNIPIAHGGKADFNISNCLGAIAVARLVFSNVVSLEEIRGKVSTFGSELAHNPGRFNIINKGKFSVVVDYAHNVDGYEKTIQLAKKTKHARLVGVIKVAGDRQVEMIKEIGEIAGRNFDYIYIKAPSADKLRGASKNVICNLLKEGVMCAGFDARKVEIVFDEEAAIKKAMKDAKKGDLVIIFSHDIEKTIKTVVEY